MRSRAASKAAIASRRRWLGITPYAAGQFTTFELPAYAESVPSGGKHFRARLWREERDRRALGTRRSHRPVLCAGERRADAARPVAWAHDFDPDRAVAATFQALPGASFVVNGAAQASDSALTTASAEMKWRNGWSAGATFEGEFSSVTASYAGKGVVRYAW